jgi:tRNA(Arg) A34 adenosine deaminase TadA
MKRKITERDRDFIERAIDLAIEGIGKGGGPFGAVITRNGKIIAEAYNEVVFMNDPTAHAEILAIRKASEATGSHILNDCTLYASCEPCPMCLGAIYWSGISAVYFASGRKDASEAGFGDDFFYSEMMLDPEKRKIRFCRVEEIDGSKVFRLWKDYEGRISY